MTELIIFYRPTNGRIIENVDSNISIVSRGVNNALIGGLAEPASGEPQQAYKIANNPGKVVTPVDIGLINPAAQGPQGQRVDLYDNVPVPITFTITDIREPDKRKTSWSKTITIPGTKNNNRIFNHIYELDRDNWMTIGSQSYWSGFNPNLRKEVILIQDGIEVFKGNLQLKSAKKFYDGNIEYEVVINGDLTSIFFDIGNAKLGDLDFNEWSHTWSKTNITNSWFGINATNNGTPYYHTTNGSPVNISTVSRDTSGRVKITTATSHGFNKLDFILISISSSIINNDNYAGYKSIFGVWSVVDVQSSTQFTINCEYPTGLLGLGTQSVTAGHLIAYKQTCVGNGYVYPMVSWGDEYDQNSFPVVSFAAGLFVKGILDKIMKATKSKYTSNFLTSEFFKRLIMIEKKSSYELTTAEVAKRSFRVGTAYNYITDLCNLGGGFAGNFNFTNVWAYAQTTSTASAPNGSTNALNLRFNQETGGVGAGVYYDGTFAGINTGEDNWSSDNAQWIVKETGEYELSASVQISLKMLFGNYVGTNTPVSNNSGSTYYPGTPNQVTNNQTSSPLGTGALGVAFKLCLFRVRNGVKLLLNETIYQMPVNSNQIWNSIYSASNPAPGWNAFGDYSPTNWKNINVTVQSPDKYFAAGDIVFCEGQYFVQAQPAVSIGFPSPAPKRAQMFYEFDPNGSTWAQKYKSIEAQCLLTISVPSFIKCQPSSKAVEGSKLVPLNFVSKDMTCKDFLTGIIKMFNLHIQPDPEQQRSYIIEPRDDFYLDGASQSDFIDWSDKIDYNSIRIQPMGELGAKTYTFENKSETDYWNKRFLDERGRQYMQYSKSIDNDFLKNEYKITLPFGSSVMINNPENSDVVMPAVHARENGVMKPLSQSAPRILLWMGPRPYTANGKVLTINSNRNGWEFLSSAEAIMAQYQAPYGQVLGSASAIAASASDCFFYPYAGTVDSPNEPLWDINWYNQETGDFVYWDSARWSNHNLYNAYWKSFITEISDPSSLVVEANFNLTATDIAKLDFRKIYVVDGIWYRLQKVIDYDAIGKESTKVELLKVKAPTKFVRKSVYTGEPIEEVLNFDRLITTMEVSYAPPKKKIQSEGFANNMNSALLSNASVSVNGKGNFISQADNIKVNGNENIVGHSAQNVHISNGNGNFISGGVKNVSLVGTDKKVIRESDVSYINGVRYKNGVPISRANLIDGGFDNAKGISAKNTTINIIDGCEDVVIMRGSQTYEDVVDSGQDAILPDMAELGISTGIVPKSKVNLSPGYRLVIAADESLTEIVREGARFVQ